MPHNALIIAVDGYSSSGKSTFAKAIARWLQYTYIDSGAMYRAVTLYALEHGLIRNGKPDKKKLIDALPGIAIEFHTDPLTGDYHTYLNNEDVEEKIRNIEVSAQVSEISRIREVRNFLVKIQRKLAGKGSVVMDGRDIGTVVFPDADLKIFMTASPEVRAERRYKELKEKGMRVNFKEVLENVNSRDRIDSGRKISPLRKADDALILDNTRLTVNEQMEWIKKIIREKFNCKL